MHVPCFLAEGGPGCCAWLLSAACLPATACLPAFCCLQVAALASLYLVHCKSWRLVQPFIEAGGLRCRLLFEAMCSVTAHNCACMHTLLTLAP